MRHTFYLVLIILITACQSNTNGDTKGQQAQTTPGCTKELKACPDGQTVGRNPENQCEFSACPEPVEGCKEDMKQCPDGSFVIRNPENACEFKACTTKKSTEPVYCTQDVKQCPDGSYVGRDSHNNCAFKPCPAGDGTE